MSIANPDQRCLRGTIVTILDRGSGDRPLRAWADMITPKADGTGGGRARVLLEAPAGLDMQSGDDIYGIGTLVVSGVDGIPDRVVLADGLDAQQRLKAQLDGASLLLAFGKQLAGDTPRPGAITADRLGLNTLLIARNAAKTGDAITDWALSLTHGLHKDVTRLVMAPALGGNAQQLEELLARDLPVQDARMMAQQLASGAVENAAGHWLFTSASADGKPVGPHDYAWSVVKPYNPARTVTEMWSDFTQLKAPGFMPRDLPDAGLWHRFTAAHELAHTVQEDFGIPHQGALWQVNAKECFADSLALLAIARETGDIDALRPFAEMRHAALLASPVLTHYTGPACTATLDLADKLHASGDLQGMSNDDLANLAAGMARKHALTEGKWAELHYLRQQVLEAGGCRFESPKGNNPAFLGDITGGVRPTGLLHQAVARDDAALGALTRSFKRSLDAVRSIAYTPRQLAEADMADAAIADWQQDVEDTLGRIAAPSHATRALVRLGQSLDWLDQAGPLPHLVALKQKMASHLRDLTDMMVDTDPEMKAETTALLAVSPRPVSDSRFAQALRDTARNRGASLQALAMAEMDLMTGPEIDRAKLAGLRADRQAVSLAMALLGEGISAQQPLIQHAAREALHRQDLPYQGDFKADLAKIAAKGPQSASDAPGP